MKAIFIKPEELGEILDALRRLMRIYTDLGYQEDAQLYAAIIEKLEIRMKRQNEGEKK